ncbi:MAG: hypothetical protein B6I19_03780 [Bacteroidetes bacterium 4572_114]|nr:MAG: hypothetical protein B6I19_03780 [Bacteroidetes bacterium 4572_114]
MTKNNLQYHIHPKDLDLVMRDEDFVIYYKNEPLTTKNGTEVSHKDARLLRHILTNITLKREIDFRSINTLNLLSFMIDNILQDNDPIKNGLQAQIINDPLLNSKLGNGGKNGIARIDEVLEYLEENPEIMNLIFWGVSVITQGLHDLLTGMDNFEAVEKNFKAHSKELTGNLLRGQTDDATKNQDGTGIIPVRVSWRTADKSIILFHDEAVCALEFLGFFEKSRKKISVISELITQGEHDKMEFKSTFRWDIRQNKKNPAIEHAALKTMAAFLNSDGGDLLLGVEDDGAIYGVEADSFANDDKFLLHVWALIKSSMGQDVSPYIKTTLEKFDNKTVCRVNCLPSPKPVFLHQKGFDEALYIRIGPSTGSLEIREALKYISEHFE